VRVNPERCLGCLSCEVACAEVRSTGVGIPRIRVSSGMAMRQERGRYTVSIAPRRYPTVCLQCDDPNCVTACKTCALAKAADGVVRLDQERCVGCGMCHMVCPFGGVVVDRSRGMVYKCDVCGGLQIPTCVAACPVQALVPVRGG
jgi:Fe-S-cluster-containing dehydrogenase component